MPLNRRRFVRGAGGLAAASTLAGCLGDDELNVTLWHKLGVQAPGEGELSESDRLDRWVAEFAPERGGNITAERVDELEEQLGATVPLGEGPELFGWAHDWMGDFDRREFVADVSEELTIDPSAEFLDVAAEATRFDGQTFGLPYAGETVALLYNQEYVDEPPETVDALVEEMDRHHAPENDSYGLAAPVDPYTLSAWAHAGEGFYFDDESQTVGVAEDATIEALEYYLETLWPYQPDITDYNEQVSAFRDGKGAFSIDGPWALDFEDADIDAENVGVAPLPIAEIGTPSPYVGVQLWYFSSVLEPDEEESGLIDFDQLPFLGEEDTSAERTDLAVDFAEWYTTNETIVTENAEHHTFVPLLESVATEFETGPVAAFVQSTLDGTAIPQHPEMREVWEPLAGAIEDVLADGTAPRTALEDAEATIVDAIEAE